MQNIPIVVKREACGSLGAMWYVENIDSGRPVKVTLEEIREHKGQVHRSQKIIDLGAGESRKLDCSNTAMGSHSGGGFLRIKYTVKGYEFS